MKIRLYDVFGEDKGILAEYDGVVDYSDNEIFFADGSTLTISRMREFYRIEEVKR